MKIKCLGGAGEVTGSAHLVMAGGSRVLRDCGFFQGSRFEAHEKNKTLFSRADGIDSVVLSHAHIDHCGNFPGLIRQGYRGDIWMTQATAELCPLMWQDSANIQLLDRKFLLKQNPDESRLPEILYDEEDVTEAVRHIRPWPYHKALKLSETISAEFHEAGHILGSSLTKMTLSERGRPLNLGFAFDLGRKGMPILKDPEVMGDLDVLVIESTYGGRIHEELSHLEDRLAEILRKTFARGGRVIVPAFALGRVQEMTYSLKRIFEAGKAPKVRVYVDSPLAARISEVFARHCELYNSEAQSMGPGFLNHDFVSYTTSKEESQALNLSTEPAVIIAASGMCESGRILHHLVHNISRPENTILFVGFLAEHTLGKKILDGEKTVRIFDSHFPVLAEIQKLNAFSAHADRNDIIDYIKQCGNLKKIILVHGELPQLESLAEAVRTVSKAEVLIPSFGQEIEI